MRARDHLMLAGGCGLVVGLAEGIALGEGWPVIWLCAGLVGSVGLVLGALQAGVWTLARRVLAGSSAMRWLDERLDPDPGSPRQPVIRLHAGGVGAVAGAIAWLYALRLLLARLDAVTDPNLRHVLILVGVLMLGAAGVVVGLVAARLMRPVFAVADRWLGLPRPRRAGRRFVFFVAVPSVALGYLLSSRYGEGLGELRVVIYLAMFPALEGVVLDLVRTARRGPLARLSTPRWLVAALVLFCFVAPFAAFASQPSSILVVRRATLAGPSLRLVHRLSDFDGDGASAWLGGGDCAPRDPGRGPFAIDLPGNGIDEDCSGADATGQASGLRPAAWHNPRSAAALEYERRRYNVVWFVVDAARADHCQLHGYDKPTTPYLAHLGKSSWVFDNAYSQSSATMMSIPSMQSGLRPASITWEKARGKLQLGGDHVTLAERLKTAGYRTAAVTGRYSRKKLPGMFQGFDDVIDIARYGPGYASFGRRSAVASSVAIQWLERDPGLATDQAEPFYLMVYMADPHDPYEPHGEAFPDFGEGEVARYDGEIAFADRYIGMFLDYLRYRPTLFDDTIVVFTADHGEEFGEHDGKVHASTCYEESLHVPLLVRIPGSKPQRVKQPVPLVDVVPTILDAIDLDAGAMTLDGASLALTAAEAMPERPIFCSVLSQKPKQGNFVRRAVRYRQQTLIHNLVAGHYELYDTAKDPAETNNLLAAAGAEPPVPLRAFLEESMRGNFLSMRLVK